MDRRLVEGERVSDDLGRRRVLDASGGEHALAGAWSEGPALVVFLRHFTCIGCSMNVVDLSPHLAEMAELGVRTVFLGCGPAASIDDFVARFRLADQPVTIWTDPGLEVHRAAGLRRSFWRTWGPVAARDFLKGFAAGHGQSRFDGDSLQQGGALLVDGDGRVAFFHANQSLGDHARAATVMEAALSLVAHTRAATSTGST